MEFHFNCLTRGFFCRRPAVRASTRPELGQESLGPGLQKQFLRCQGIAGTVRAAAALRLRKRI